jgi:hypothetical protein
MLNGPLKDVGLQYDVRDYGKFRPPVEPVSPPGAGRILFRTEPWIAILGDFPS